MKLKYLLKTVLCGALCSTLLLSDSAIAFSSQALEATVESATELSTEQDTTIENDGTKTPVTDVTDPTDSTATDETLTTPFTEVTEPDVTSTEESLMESDLVMESSNLRANGVVNGYYEITVTQSAISATGAYKAIQAALDEAQTNATDALPYKVIIEPGSYTLSQSLHIYSNTYLYAKDVTIKQESGVKTNMIKVGESDDLMTGYYYKNITIEGGTWNENGNSATAIKAAHAENFTMKNVTVQNVSNAHLMEVAGIKGLTITGCTFKDQKLDKGGDKLYYEAIQIDVPLSSHLEGVRSEDLTMQNVIIDNCTFSNVPRGVGSHTAILNSYATNISITNCSFTDMKSAAIQSMNWINCKITGNTITNSPRGIAIYTIRDEGTFLASTAVAEGGIASNTPTAYVAPPVNQDILIDGNKITCGGTDPYADYEDTGILVGGISFSKAYKGEDGDKIPAGDYYASGVTVTNNTIDTIGHGIRLQDTKNSTVSNNTINYTGGSSKISYHGIQLREGSTNNAIENNTVSKINTNGIYVYTDSSAASIKGNKLVSVGKYGIDVEGGSADTVSDNSISKPGEGGVFIYSGGKINTLNNNTITSPSKIGINVDKGNAETVSNNTVSNPGTYGVYLHNSAEVTTLTENTLTSCGKHAIFVEGSTIGTISSNTITSPVSNGIYIYKKGKATTITGNTITSAGKYGIDAENATATNITNNKISQPGNHGIVVQNSAKAKKITGNTITSGKRSGMRIASLKCAMEISSNKVSKCKEHVIVIGTETTKYTITLKKNNLTGNSKVKGIVVNSGKVTISDNTIQSTIAPINLSGTVKGTIGINTLTKNKKSTITVGGTNCKVPSAPKSVKVKKSGKRMKISWKKATNANGYIVYRSTSATKGFKKIATLSGAKKVSYTDKTVKSGKTYYYKIVPIAKVSKDKVTITGKESKVVSKKM